MSENYLEKEMCVVCLETELGWLEPGVRWEAVGEDAGRQIMSGAL